MSTFFQEILNSFKGGPSSVDIGKFKAGAIAGGRDVLGIEPLPVDPSKLMSVPPPTAEPAISEAFMSIAPATTALPPMEEQTAMPEGPLPKPVPAALRYGASPTQPVQPAGELDNFDALLAQAGRTVDRGGQKADLEAQRAALLKQADAEKELTDEEKVAMALLAAAPGLLGAIAGGAISGGYGAAAGAAGGLQGGAQGIQMIASGKEAKRKEAKSDAEKLGDRIAALDEKIAEQQEKAADRELELQVRERAAKKADKLEHEKMGLQEKIAREGNRAQLTGIAMTQKGAMDRAKLEAMTDMQKAQLAASAPGKVTEFEGTSAYHADALINAMPALEQGDVARGSITGALKATGLGRFFADPRLQQYAVAAKQFINAINRRESGAAITDAEIEAAYDRYLPVASDSPQTVAYKRQQRNEAFRRMALAAGAAGNRISVPEYYTQQKHTADEDAMAVEWARNNPSDTRAQKILQLHGVK